MATINDNYRVTSRNPYIEIIDTERKIVLATSNKLDIKALHKIDILGYSFSLHLNDTQGSFNFSIFPNTDLSFIKPFQTVKIYENGDSKIPSFTGVIKSKKVVTQVGEKINRRVSVSGIAAAGLIADYKINLDVKTMAITGVTLATDELRKDLTTALSSELTISGAIAVIWNHFKSIANKFKALSTSTIQKFVDSLCIPGVFDTSTLGNLQYPLGNVFSGECETNVYALIDGVTPQPIYEKYIFQDFITGKQGVRIRECPFDSVRWLAIPCHQIMGKDLISFDLTQDNSEVYTVFYAYCKNYSIDSDRAFILESQQIKENPNLATDNEKYGKYGYRLLQASFLGYENKNTANVDAETGSTMRILSERLKSWYSNLDEFYKGNVCLITDDMKPMPQPGEKISFLNGEFYVVGSQHDWSYMDVPRTTLAIERGGVYVAGKYIKPIEDPSGYDTGFARGEV